MTIRHIKVACAHGIEDGEETFIDKFRLVPFLGGPVWVSTVQGYSRVQALKDDEVQIYPLQSEPGERPIRQRWPIECHKCRRNLPLRDENLQALMQAAAAEGIDTLRLDKLC